MGAARRRCFVTGGNRGLGFEIAAELLRSGACGEVVLGVRDLAAGETARRRLLAELAEEPGAPQDVQVSVVQLELACNASVRRAALQVGARPLHVLVNNAGVFPPLNASDTRQTFQTNHLGPFLLTQLLLPALRSAGSASAPAHVVHISSRAHRQGVVPLKLEHEPSLTIEVEGGSTGGTNAGATARFLRHTLLGARRYVLRGYWAYCDSKLQQLMCACELQRRLARRGERRVVSNAVHPGLVRSELFRSSALARFFTHALPWLYLSPRAAARRVTALLHTPSAVLLPGAYFSGVQRVQPSPACVPNSPRRRAQLAMLWAASERLVELSDAERAAAELN